jgi:anti-anti-sigma factor
MEITSQRVDDFIEVLPKGRLDGYWADHLAGALEEIMRQGHDRIRLNLSEVVYISSMGVRVLVTFYKKLEAIQGAFVISEPSPFVTKTLDMMGLLKTLMSDAPPAKQETKTNSVQLLDHENAKFEVFPLQSSGRMQCRVVGNAALLAECGFSDVDCRTQLFPESSVAVGLGAFGSSFADCKGRFGEFLAVAGAAAYLPSDGSNVPDYVLSEGTLVPELQVLYGLVCEGSFSSLARFDAKPEAGVVGLSELVRTALDIAGADSACVVIVAESAGLVGASLRKPPVNGGKGATFFSHPGIRRWLSFTTERAHTRALAVVVGVASKAPDEILQPLVRPLEGQLSGHFHAAPFSYRPLQRGLIDLKKTVRSLFEGETLLGLMHLIGDDRELSDASESEFVRGACWIAPIANVKGDRG